jgi:chromosome transmission fidelity protein 1
LHFFTFFLSLSYLQQVLETWKAQSVFEEISRHKRIFKEADGPVSILLEEYAKEIDGGERNGAILCCTVNGKLSEGINFSDDLARYLFIIIIRIL